MSSFIVIGDDWGRHVSTIQHIFSRICVDYPVVWINSFGHRSPELTLYDMKRAAAKTVQMIRGSIDRPGGTGGGAPQEVVAPRALPWHHISAVRRLNAWSLRRDILRASRMLPPEPVFVSETPLAADLVGRLGERRAIYFCMDDYGELPGVDKAMLAPYEQDMLDRVDTVVVTATALLKKKVPRSGHAKHLPQGVNYEHFAAPLPVPADLRDLPRPIVGFAGGVSDCVDYELVRQIASSLPSGSLALVGPITAPSARGELSGIPNVHLLGARPYEQLPAYVQAFDVGIVPYVLNAWTEAVDPLKVLEYLAAGIPVVSTPLPEVERYRGPVIVAPEPDFAAATHRALADSRAQGSRRARQELAQRNTWEKRAEQFLDTIGSN